jgi:DNA-binding MarR family transcriptional regulator
VSTPAVDREAILEALDVVLRESSGLGVLLSQAVADRVGMNPSDLEALEILIRRGPMTAGRLAELTGLTTGAITGLVDRLERRGYARREPDPADRRRVIVQPLTERAEGEIGPFYAGMSQAGKALLATYSDDELALILDFLTRAAVMTSEQIAALRSG